MQHISVSFMIFISPHPQRVQYLGVTKSASHHQGCIGMCWPVTTSSCCIFTASLRPWPNAAFQTTHQQLHTTSRKHRKTQFFLAKFCNRTMCWILLDSPQFYHIPCTTQNFATCLQQQDWSCGTHEGYVLHLAEWLQRSVLVFKETSKVSNPGHPHIHKSNRR